MTQIIRVRDTLSRNLVLAIVLTACFAAGFSSHPAAADDKMLGSITSGARLYDDWMRELAIRKPKAAHRLYPAKGILRNEPWKTWRCVSCHGWDYLGEDGAYHTGPNYTGIKGISDKVGTPVQDIISILTDDKHDYGKYLDEQSLLDLANFVSKGQVKMDQFINPVTGQALGENVKSSVFFSSICTNCHGSDGRMMQSIPPIGDVARRNPWQSFHKIVNGHPGDSMPALRAFGMRTAVGTLAYAQKLPSHDPIASIARGGKLYDDWARVVRYRFPKDPHPAYPKDQQVAEGSSSWRCVECHGWDYKGRAGIRGIRNMDGGNPAKVMEILTDDVHDMDQFLKYKDILDLANFVVSGQVEMNEYIDPETRNARGEGDEHNLFFVTLCATCHGDKGADIRTMPPMGRVAKEDPWKALHKMFHGHPGDDMPSWQMPLTLKVTRNLLAKLQTLPMKR